MKPAKIILIIAIIVIATMCFFNKPHDKNNIFKQEKNCPEAILSISANGSSYKEHGLNNGDLCDQKGCYDNEHDDLASGEWEVAWDGIGKIHGTSKCDSANCWCKPISWISNTKDSTQLISPWFFANSTGRADLCIAFCTSECANYFYSDSEFRSTVFENICNSNQVQTSYNKTISLDAVAITNYAAKGKGVYCRFNKGCDDEEDLQDNDIEFFKNLNLQPGEWLITYDNKTIRGIAICNDVPENEYNDTNMTDNIDTNVHNGEFCWCKPISLIKSNAEPILLNSYLVFNTSFGDNEFCSQYCPGACVLSLQGTSNEDIQFQTTLLKTIYIPGKLE